MVDGKLVPAAREAAHAAVVQRVDAAQLSVAAPIIGRLVDGWLADLEAIVGGVADAEIDPRFVEGVLVEVKRS